MIRSPIVTRKRALMENPEETSETSTQQTVPQESEQTSEVTVPQDEAVSLRESPMTTTLQAVLGGAVVTQEAATYQNGLYRIFTMARCKDHAVTRKIAGISYISE